MDLSLFISDSKALQIISFVINIVFITWNLTSFFQNRKHKKDLANIFSSEYKTSKELADSIKDSNVKLQIYHHSEFLKAITRNLLHRRYDEVGGENHNFLLRCLKSLFLKKDKE